MNGRDASRGQLLLALVLCALPACEGKARRVPRASTGSAGVAGADATGGTGNGATGGAGGTDMEGGSGGTSTRHRVTGSVDTFGTGTTNPRAYVLAQQTLLELPLACTADYCVTGGLTP